MCIRDSTLSVPPVRDRMVQKHEFSQYSQGGGVPFFPRRFGRRDRVVQKHEFFHNQKTPWVPPAPCRAGRSPSIRRLFRAWHKNIRPHAHARKYWRTVGGVSRIFWPCAKKSANERATPRTPPGKGDPRHFSPWGESKLDSLPAPPGEGETDFTLPPPPSFPAELPLAIPTGTTGLATGNREVATGN